MSKRKQKSLEGRIATRIRDGRQYTIHEMGHNSREVQLKPLGSGRTCYKLICNLYIDYEIT